MAEISRVSVVQGSTKLRRIVVKLGTNVIMRPDGKVALGLLCGLVEQIASLRTQGIEVLMVSSGAVGLGMERLGLTRRPTVVAQVQACAAIGQSRLMALYDDAFDRLGCPIAQVLLTEDDFRDSDRHANLRATLDALLTLSVIPIVNENDTVSTAELDRPAELPQRERIFGDNDKLSALLAKHIGADLLVMLSDVDGLFDRNPSEPNAKMLHGVEEIDERILALAQGGNGRGRGGMISKLESARIVVRANKPVIIANGRTPQVLERIVAGETVGTRFAPAPMLQEVLR
ncbi:glutamate 5-kinase [Granulicella sp. 5B5]|uniref:glutamate 5-kinase n=1 Tax=Granulicella sp. 5B5 TaxID=1617967 RepID=UPI002107BB4E|nr:glutamate 5-kinase [Granulicella sp. 5B5]